jgi:hypothetical protein
VDLSAGGWGMLSCAAGSPCLTFKELEILSLILPSRRLMTLRTAGLFVNAIATLVAVGFLADGLPSLVRELRRERDARAHVEIEAFLASLTPDERARLYRRLSSTSVTSASVHDDDAQDSAVLEKFRLFWEPFQSVRKQAQLWGDALRSVSSSSKAGEVGVAFIVLTVVVMSSLALRAHGLRLGTTVGD